MPPDRAPADIAAELRAIEVDAVYLRVCLLLCHLFASRNVVVDRSENSLSVAWLLAMFQVEIFVAPCVGRKPSKKEPSVLEQDGELPAASSSPEQAPAMQYANDQLD